MENKDKCPYGREENHEDNNKENTEGTERTEITITCSNCGFTETIYIIPNLPYLHICPVCHIYFN
jgi:predicted nucleic-acid-binding Zn-ribbon protein